MSIEVSTAEVLTADDDTASGVGTRCGGVGLSIVGVVVGGSGDDGSGEGMTTTGVFVGFTHNDYSTADGRAYVTAGGKADASLLHTYQYLGLSLADCGTVFIYH